MTETTQAAFIAALKAALGPDKGKAAALSTALSLHRSAVSHWLKGRRAPTLAHVRAMAPAFMWDEATIQRWFPEVFGPAMDTARPHPNDLVQSTLPSPVIPTEKTAAPAPGEEQIVVPQKVFLECATVIQAALAFDPEAGLAFRNDLLELIADWRKRRAPSGQRPARRRR